MIVRKALMQTLLAVILAGPVTRGQVSAIEVSDGGGLPRTIWAARLPGGPLRVVFIAPYSAHQDSFELMKRFDIDGEVVPVAGPSNVREIGIRGHYWPDLLKSRDRVLGDLRRALARDWEVVAMSDFPHWSAYPEDIRASIIASVRRGKSLVICSLKHGLEGDLKAASLKLEHTEIGASRFCIPGQSKGSPAIYRSGKGHVVHVSAATDRRFGYLLPATPLRSEFERYVARVGWFLFRAARPRVAPCIRSTTIAEDVVAIEFTEDPRLDAGRVDIAVRECSAYRKVQTTEGKVEPGRRVKLPPRYLPTGDYHVEAVVSGANGVALDWDVLRFRQAGPVTLKAVTLSHHGLESSTVAPGQEAKFRLDVEGATEGLRMRASWFDHWGRLLERTKEQPYAPTLTMAAPQGSLSVLNRVEVTLLSDRGAEAVAAAEVLMPQNVRPTDFHVLYWNTGLRSSWRARLQYDALRRLGSADAFSNCATSAGGARSAALAHLRTAPYTTAFHAVKLASQLLNEDWLAKMEDRARKAARAHKPYNTLAYTLGDENYVNAFVPEGRFADTPSAWRGFQDWLHKSYRDLASLNEQWATRFKSWQEIRFDTEKQMLPSLKNPSAWVDYRMYISHCFAAAHQRMRRAIQAEHPGALVGWDGCEHFSSYDGYDWWQMTRDMGLVQVYHQYLLPSGYPPKIFNGLAVKSFGADAALSGCWMNGADRRYGGRYIPWYLCLNGWNSVWWWHATFLHPANGALTWDLEPTPIVAGIAQAAREIKNGLGTLIAHATKQIDPIAIHYSENNWHASTIESGVANHVNNLGAHQQFWMQPELVGRAVKPDEEMRQIWGGLRPKGHYAAASAGFILLLHDLGYQPCMMARQQIEAGALLTERIKVLVLPFVVSLSDEEIRRIRGFVESGGLLIADYRCGLRDLHGRLRAKPALDDVFGIKRQGSDVRRARAHVVLEYRGRAGCRFESIFRESIAAAGAAATGCHDDGTTALFAQSFGEGRAVYLNADLYAYDQMRRQGTEAPVRELFRLLLIQEADLFAPFLVEHERGRPVAHTEVTRLRDGCAQYIGVLRDFVSDDRAAKTIRLPFQAGSHVYDVRRAKSLGDRGNPTDTLEAGEAKLYAALPYAVDGVTLACPAKARRGLPVEIKVAVKASTPNLGPHAARLQVAGPDGGRPEYLARVLYLPKGLGTFAYVPALNAPAGTWSAEVVEVVSGKRARAAFQLE